MSTPITPEHAAALITHLTELYKVHSDACKQIERKRAWLPSEKAMAQAIRHRKADRILLLQRALRDAYDISN